MTERTNSN